MLPGICCRAFPGAIAHGAPPGHGGGPVAGLFRLTSTFTIAPGIYCTTAIAFSLRIAGDHTGTSPGEPGDSACLALPVERAA